MSNATGKLTISGLAKKIFVIPYYQRGYRWTENEAQKLFDDLLEFAQADEKEYCLQPVVLQAVEKQKNWENFPQEPNETEILRVVDGQQRLTTIAILWSLLGISKNWEIYYIAEQNTLSGLLKPESSPQTINDHFRGVVKKAFTKYEDAKKARIKTLFEDHIKSVSFLRYDIPDDDKDTEGHDAFVRLNDGKTPLTSSELIRALYMVNAGGLSLQERMEISKEWEMIENTLRDEQFWLMFNSEGISNTPTRIDLLFALVMGVSLKDAKANPRIVFEELDQHTSDWDLKKVWHAVLRCFWWMQSCYTDVKLFNYLCWIHEFTEISAKTIYDAWRSYSKPEDFKKRMIAIIEKEYNGKKLEEFTYECAKHELRQLFVLLNILDCNHSKERFRFDLYKKENWDIEHIDSQTTNELANQEDQKEWLCSAWNEYRDKLKADPLFCPFDEKNISTDRFSEKFQAVWEIMKQDGAEELKNGNVIGNLALLNTPINRSYKNAIFPAKRKLIKKFIVSGECYVPPCTAKAFMKFYTESPSKITYWLQADSDGYFNQMEKYFTDFQEISTELQLQPIKSIQNDFQKKGGNAVSGNRAEKPQADDSKKRLSGAVTFSELMNRYHVIIPKIQRLYVQGRPDSHGKKCLTGFAQTLVNTVTTGTADLSLDFIYGIQSGDDFYPLDGQQRLTTLLLLSWLCGETHQKNWSFRYDSRRAAECFMEELLKSEPPKLEKPDNYKLPEDGYLPLCSDAIKKSDWFLSVWEEDAGIAGMLNMLDSLYSKLLDSGKPEFNFSRITFFVNYLDASKDSYDQIFLKMNSRGKPLTAWENVKAILDKNAPVDTRAKWQENLNNTWQESLWKKLDDNVKDKISFLDSKMLSVVELALACAGYGDKEKVMDNTFRLAQWLENRAKEDNKEKFYEICSIFFSALGKQPDKNSMENALRPAWEEKSQWPDFNQDTLKDFYRPLLAYYAAKKSTAADWMRVVWNIIENAEISRINFPSVFRLIQELSEYADKILEHLSGNNEINFNFAGAQVAEERAKAKRISDDGTWKVTILEAEKHAFFKGAIRFLFLNEEGKIDWSKFDTKFSKAKEFFDGDGLQDRQYPNANKILLSYCMDWNSQLKRQCLFGASAGNWKQILLNRNFSNPIHQLLIGNSIKQDEDIVGEYCNEIRLLKAPAIWPFINDSNAKDSYQLEWRDNACCLWLKNRPAWTFRLRESVLLTNFMQAIPAGIKRNMDNDIDVNGKTIFKNVGAFMKFIYEKGEQKYYFIWQHWGCIDLCDENFNRIMRNGNAVSFNLDQAWRQKENWVNEYFISQLNELLERD